MVLQFNHDTLLILVQGWLEHDITHQALYSRLLLAEGVVALALVVLLAATAMMTKATGASNEKAKRELGWQPHYASWRQGFAQGLG